MGINEQIADWLENRWVTPAYSGWLLGNRPLEPPSTRWLDGYMFWRDLSQGLASPARGLLGLNIRQLDSASECRRPTDH